MCQAREDGGVRCAVHRSEVMAVMSVVSRQTGLSPEQTKQIFHSLKREGRNMERTTALRDVEFASLRSVATQEEKELFADALQNDGDRKPDIDYAVSRLSTRAAEQSERLEADLGKVAEQRGWTLGEAKKQFNEAYLGLGNKRNPTTLRDNPDAIDGVALNPAFLMAIDKLKSDQERGERLVTEFTPIRRSEILQAAGYNADNGRLELKNRLGTANLAYHSVPESTYRALTLSRDPDTIFLNNIHQNPDYTYANSEAAEADATSVRCASCGQFRASAHQCPSREEAQSAEAAHEAQRQSSEEEEAVAQREIEAAANIIAQAAVEYLRGLLAEDATEGDAEEPPVKLRASEAQVLINQRRNPLAMAEDYADETFDNEVVVNYVRSDEGETMQERSELKRIADEYHDGDIGNIQGVFTPDEAAPGGSRYLRPLLPQEHVFRDTEGKQHLVTVKHSFTSEEADAEEIERRAEAQSEEALEMMGRLYSSEAVIVPEAGRRTRTVRFTNEGDFYGTLANMTDVKKVTGTGQEIFVPMNGVVTPPSHVDVNGNSWSEDGRPVGGETVQGRFGFTVDENGAAEITTTERSLRCQCPDYRDKYRCVHISYAQAHLANVAQQLLPVPDPEKPTPLRRIDTPFGTQLPVGVKNDLEMELHEGDGVTSHFTLRQRRVPLPQVTNAVPMADLVEIGYVRTDLLPEQWETARRAYSLSRLRLQNSPRDVNRALVYGPVKVELRGRMFPQTQWTGFDATNGQYGDTQTSDYVIVDKDENDEIIIKERHLKCPCADYQENYYCRHTEEVDDDAMRNLLDTTNTATAIGRSTPPTDLIPGVRSRVEAMGVTAISDPESALQAYNQLRLEETQPTNLRGALSESQRNLSQLYSDRASEVAKGWEERNDPGYSSEDSSEFYAHYQEAMQQKKRRESPIEYKTSGVLDGLSNEGETGSRKFGVELEFDVDESDPRKHQAALAAIGRELHDAGITSGPVQGYYGRGAHLGWEGWSYEQDQTVSGELVSPIMTDTPENWENLRKAVQIIKKHGGHSSKRTGGHVHVSSGSYGESVAKHAELTRQMKESQDVLFRLASDPGRGSHRGTKWCSPNISTNLSGDIAADNTENIWFSASKNRESTVNIGSSGDSVGGHVEFRVWDGSLDESVIQQQIKLSVAMTEHAEQVVHKTGQSAARTAPSLIGAGAAREKLLKSKDTDDPQTFHKANRDVSGFIGSLFRKNEDRKDIAALFAITNWQKKSMLD